MNRKYFLEEEVYDSFDANVVQTYCRDLANVETTWRGCLNSNAVDIKIEETEPVNDTF